MTKGCVATGPRYGTFGSKQGLVFPTHQPALCRQSGPGRRHSSCEKTHSGGLHPPMAPWAQELTPREQESTPTKFSSIKIERFIQDTEYDLLIFS